MNATVLPTREQILDFCAEDPVERVFLEDVARRGLGRFTAVEDERGRLTALCHAGANVVPSGRGCAAFAVAAAASGARMLIGEERAVGELWDAARARLPQPRDDRPGQPVYVLSEAPEPGETGLRQARPSDLDLLLPACAAAHEEEIGIDPLSARPRRLPLAHAAADRGRPLVALARGRRDPLQGRGVGVDAERRPAPAGLVRSRGARGTATRSAHSPISAGSSLAQTPTVCLFVRPENTPALRLYDSIGMTRALTYRSLIF